MNLAVFLMAVVINTLLCLTQYLFEQRDRKKELLSQGTQLFLVATNKRFSTGRIFTHKLMVIFLV